MAYATQTDIVEQHGEQALLLVADRDNDGVIDADVVSVALEKASSEIDAHIGKRHSVPTDEASGILTRICCDIAMYRLSGPGQITDDRRTRFEDARRDLKAIAEGTIVIGETEPKPTAGNAKLITQDRIFKRDTTRRVW